MYLFAANHSKPCSHGESIIDDDVESSKTCFRAGVLNPRPGVSIGPKKECEREMEHSSVFDIHCVCVRGGVCAWWCGCGRGGRRPERELSPA